jgi:hypothetical protein
MIARTPVSNPSQGARRAKPRSSSKQRPDDRIAVERAARLFEVEVEVGNAAGVLHEVDESVPAGQVRAQQEVIGAARQEFQHAGVAVDHDRAPVRVSRDVLDAGDRACGEVADERLPVEWAVEGKPQEQTAIGDQPVRLAAAGAQHPR